MRTMLQANPRHTRHRAARRHERGAAMVEAAFMMPMFVMLFFTSIYAHNLNAKQISLNLTTRAQSWALAMYNCSKGPGSPEGETLQAANSGGSGEPTQITLKSTNPSTSGSAAMSALSGGSIMGMMSTFMGMATGILSGLFPDPPGSQSQVKDSVSWRMPNLYNGAGVGQTNSTPVQQTVTLVCNEQAKTWSFF